MTLSDKYPEFDHTAGELSKFIATAGMVTMMLKDGRIIHHTPKDMSAFIKWLQAHKVADIKGGN